MAGASEMSHQITLVTWFEKEYPDIGARLVASMNGAFIAGGKNKYGLISKYKSSGMRNGFPDLFLPVPSGGYNGLFIELKKESGGRTSPEQKDWLDFLNSEGYMAVVCKGWESAKDAIEGYLSEGARPT